MKKIELVCPDISCEHCAMTIKRELAALAGVKDVSVDIQAKKVTLEVATDQDLDAAIALLAEIGYPPAV